MRKLEIINENDEVIGIDTRENIHKNGLLHREVHVWFVTPDKKIILQRRGQEVETAPGLLDATAGGHVEPGTSYLESAIMEIKEETGLTIDEGELIFIGKIQSKFNDRVTGKINNVIRSQYAYLYNGDPNDLLIEDNKGAGFESFSVGKLLNLTESEKTSFVSVFGQQSQREIFQKIIKIIFKSEI